jgi:hypothetical protein
MPRIRPRQSRPTRSMHARCYRCIISPGGELPAAEAVGSDGYVLGVDLADELLELARVKAKQRDLKNVEFCAGNMLALGLRPASFDAVICVFGIFFAPDMRTAVREFWGLVRPRRSTGDHHVGPALLRARQHGLLGGCAHREAGPLQGLQSLGSHFGTWRFAQILVSAADVVAEEGLHMLRSAEDWWPIVLGTGYRGTIEQLDTDARESVRRECLDFIRRRQVAAVEANVVYGVAKKNS